MAKSKSKKSKKGSKAGATETAAAQPPPPPKQLNPFYIEPPAAADESYQSQKWDGDYDWNDDEEQAGLIGQQGEQRSWDEREVQYNGQLMRRQRQRQAHMSQPWKARACLLLSVIALIFWVLLSSFSANDDSPSSPASRISPDRTNENFNTTLIEPTRSENEKKKDFQNNDTSTPLSPAAEDNNKDGDNSILDEVDGETSGKVSGDVDVHTDDARVDDDTNNNKGDGTKDEKAGEADDDVRHVDEPATNASSTNSTSDSAPLSKNIQIVVMGERHSGVDWLLETLKSCYTNSSVTSGITRGAYWFQDAVQQDPSRTVVVVGIVRDPYDWLSEMWLHPEYMPAHQNGNESLPLRDFVAKKWTIDSEHAKETNTSITAISVCQLGFTPDQVVPCLKETDAVILDNITTPIYELDPDTGHIFANIMALRAAKLHYLLDTIPVLWNLNRGVALVKFEQGLMDSFIKIMNAEIGMVASCSTKNNILARPTKALYTSNAALDKQLKSPAYLKWMLNNVDWQLEARVGYSTPHGTL